MIRLLAAWQFWLLSLILGPIAWLVLIKTYLVLSKQYGYIRKWYIGLPVYYWPCMLLVILGAKNLSKKHCEWKQLDGKWYVTIHTPGFQAEDPRR